VRLLDYFDSFLKETVNLNQTRLDLLESRVEALVYVAGMDEVLGPKVVTHIPQGSWAHKTIIKPIGNREFDADFLLHLTEGADWSADPKRYLNEVEAAFRRSSLYQNMVQRKNRCVRIAYADDCHIDIVPYIVRDDASQVIVCRDTNSFEATNPEGFTAWMKEKDGITNGNLRKVIRLLKYLRDYKGTFSCKSVILTTVIGEAVRAWDADTRYADVPTTLKSVVADLDAWLQIYPTKPSIEDPSCPGTTFDHRWDQATYTIFRDAIHRYSAWIPDAYDERDLALSLEKWQKVFGPDFKAPAKAAVVATPMARAAAPTEKAAPNEEFITSRFPVKIRYRATIVGRMLPNSPVRNRILPKGQSLRFHVSTDTPKPYRLFWKVRNFGAEAEQAAGNGLRGQIEEPTAPDITRSESTLYKGRHYIECWIEKGGEVVASDRHYVEIGD
jgi:Second Messenger Oligonucleotide or Dinucleotide Synthetase domain/Adenylyl/Guanylyl and SMODS C-terminal sensor domain